MWRRETALERAPSVASGHHSRKFNHKAVILVATRPLLRARHHAQLAGGRSECSQPGGWKTGVPQTRSIYNSPPPQRPQRWLKCASALVMRRMCCRMSGKLKLNLLSEVFSCSNFWASFSAGFSVASSAPTAACNPFLTYLRHNRRGAPLFKALAFKVACTCQARSAPRPESGTIG